MRKLLLFILSLIIAQVTLCQVPSGTKPDGIYAEFNTNRGLITVQLRYDKAPVTVANFIGLAEGTITNSSVSRGKSFYEGSIWHRVVKGHVIQGGSPRSDKKPENEDASATGYMIPNEISDLSHNKAGMVGMANSGPNTNTCQYYITLANRSYLDGNYTVFGEVTEGMDVVNSIVRGDTTRSIKIIRIGKEAKKIKVNDKTFKKMVDAQWLKIKEAEALKKKKDETFIESNYPGMQSHPSGVRYRIVTGGAGNTARDGSVLTLSYSGKLTDGTEFNSSSAGGRPERSSSPASFQYVKGSGHMISGLRTMLDEMKAGETRLMVIPPELAFGNAGYYALEVPGQKRLVISPGEILIMQVTLTAIN